MTPQSIAMGLLCLVAALACRSEDPPAKPEAAAPPAKSGAEAEPEPDAKAAPKPDAGTASPPGVIGMLEDARVKTACTELQMLRSAVEMFTAIKGSCPPDLATLEAQRMIDRLRDDPWGNTYQLRCSELELRSAGPDGEPKTSDDVVLGATGDTCR